MQSVAAETVKDDAGAPDKPEPVCVGPTLTSCVLTLVLGPSNVAVAIVVARVVTSAVRVLSSCRCVSEHSYRHKKATDHQSAWLRSTE